MSCVSLTLTPTVFADNITAEFIFNLLLFACSLTSVPQNMQIPVHAPSWGNVLDRLKGRPFPGLTLRKHFKNKSNYLPQKSRMIPLCLTFSTSAAASEILPIPYFFFPLISTKIPRCFSADCPPKLSQKAFICYSSVRARARATKTGRT